jgi:threonine/homoserine/homoserine lactone efflux protein
MPLGSFASFAALDLLLVMTPGADWAFAITTGLNGEAVVAAIAGLAAGYLVQAALVTAGVGALVAQSPAALSIITLAGGAYLLWLGLTVARRAAPVSASKAPDASSARGALRGVAVSALNPKGFLLFFAVLPQFVVANAAWPLTVQLAALGAFHVAACGVVYLSVALAARGLLRSRPRVAEIIDRLSGVAMILIGLALILERLSTG